MPSNLTIRVAAVLLALCQSSLAFLSLRSHHVATTTRASPAAHQVGLSAVQESAQFYGCSPDRVENLLLQRAIQTQIYYLHDLRDEPQSSWLAGFLDHSHLDEEFGGEFVVKGKNAGLGLLRVEWQDYLAQLAAHPNVGIEVEIAAPNRGFVSERELRNPFLQQQQLLTIKYTETIEPAKVAQRLISTTRVLVKEAQKDLTELAASDNRRVGLDLHTPILWAPDDFATRNFKLFNADLAETTPLSDLNQRATHRYCTVLAARALLAELQGGDETKGAVAGWLEGWAAEWLPLLAVGADDEARERIGRVSPGMFATAYWSYEGGGADASEALEAMWQTLPFHDNLADLHGAVTPRDLATRLRQLRAAAADGALATLAAMQAELDALQAAAAAAPGAAASGAELTASQAGYAVARPYQGDGYGERSY